ncbi:MAG: alpha-1,4-glucan--maltose-1-phosphate maltosyltransferase [Planctomycetes bacterium]|nr:alpha-1,4-glucan--maltose-1-phosphate maltosyltransferase [Planctomycetota bacterium]
MATKAGKFRVVIENVEPSVDCGRFPVKRVAGDRLEVEADIFADGHDELRCHLLLRKAGESRWLAQTPLEFLGNDRWRGQVTLPDIGLFHYSIKAWVDRFQSWHRDLTKRLQAGQDVAVEIRIGGRLVESASRRARGEDARKLRRLARVMLGNDDLQAKIQLAQEGDLVELMARYPSLRHATLLQPFRAVVVDPLKARFSAWYEMFPRSASATPGAHGTFRDCEARLAYIAQLGFDVLYFPPIHPIGRTFRKGKNNTMTPTADDPGSPWGIGAREGGHQAIHPELGTLADFRRLLKKARQQGIDIALDIALQCSPDHPYVKKHPEWFRHRPDGTIQYAENPPKKYQDIYPIDFDSQKWRELWSELLNVFLFWIDQGVRIFRVDNPHTKPFSFWEWLIGEIKRQYPDVIFLSEAFTRPRIMYRLAKLGFTQSYTYFAWRNTKEDLTKYFTELTQTEVAEFFRPNLWPNTPDILHEFLQKGGRPAFALRFVLAATLGASYGIYGPAYELGVNQPFAPGSEEYFDSEKYEIKHWNLDAPESLKELIGRVNRIRRANPALHADRNLVFHTVDNPEIICYSKHTDDRKNTVLVVVNLSPNQRQLGWVNVNGKTLGLAPDQAFTVHDLLTDAHYTWQGVRNYVELDPQRQPAHVFCIARHE